MVRLIRSQFLNLLVSDVSVRLLKAYFVTSGLWNKCFTSWISGVNSRNSDLFFRHVYDVVYILGLLLCVFYLGSSLWVEYYGLFSIIYFYVPVLLHGRLI